MSTIADRPALLANRRVTLALQGGASYGAYTWGVLDGLLEDGSLRIEGVTGASSGAINAVALADGLAAAGPKGAREALRRFWEYLASAAEGRRRSWRGDIVSLLRSLSNPSSTAALHHLTTRLVAGFRIDSRRMEPLRSALEATIDFERLRSHSTVRVFVNATNCRSKEIRVFPLREITPDVVCASACIPLLFEAVEIDGEYYWDGGFLGNPAIFPVLYACRASDVILVETHAPEAPRPPASAAELLSRVVDVSSTASLVRELRMIEFVSHLARTSGGGLPSGVREVRIHRVPTSPLLASLAGAGGFRADLAYFNELYDIGREAVRHWLEHRGMSRPCPAIDRPWELSHA